MAERDYKEFEIKHLTSYLSPVTDILAIQHIGTMKYLYIVIIALVLGCSSKQNSCTIPNADNQWQRIDTTYYLKNGYLLHEFTSDDSLLIFSLEKNDFQKTIVEQGRFMDDSVFDVRYDDNYTELDFEKYFVISHKLALTEVSYYIFEKSTGKNVFDGYDCFISNIDELTENNDSLLLCVCRPEKDYFDYKLFLCDLSKDIFQELNIDDFFSETSDMPPFIADCFRLQKTDNDSVVITYNNDNQCVKQKIALKYTR